MITNSDLEPKSVPHAPNSRTIIKQGNICCPGGNRQLASGPTGERRPQVIERLASRRLPDRQMRRGVRDRPGVWRINGELRDYGFRQLAKMHVWFGGKIKDTREFPDFSQFKIKSRMRKKERPQGRNRHRNFVSVTDRKK